ncbi:MAG: hypothetical protein JWR39_1938 [Devosia sp.]|jgi:hypothetical protein|nr:hypothetical protein [Devosia sp.]
MIEDKLRETIVGELQRQASNKPGNLKVSSQADRLRVEGEINLDELVMAVLGSVAGGP